MSRNLVTLIYTRKAGSLIRKAVLTAMADRANDDGSGVWVSKQRVANEIEASRQGVVNAIKSLLKDKILNEVGQRQCPNGWTMEYSIDVDVVLSLEAWAPHVVDPPIYVGVKKENTPPQEVEGTPPPGVGHPPTPCSQTVLNRPEPTTDKSVVSAQATPPAPKPEQPKKSKAAPRGSSRGSRITENWNPTPKDYAFAQKHNLTREDINREADRFRNYWLSASGRNAAKRDWEATWRNWLTGEYGIVTKRAASRSSGAGSAGQSGGGGLVAAGLRNIREARGHGEPIPERGGVDPGYVIEREAG